MKHDVAVVGAGVIGLMSAWSLARAGLSVVVVERGGAGQESSWAGGGIVSPLYPWRYGAAVSALAHWSQDFYPQLAAQLIDAVGLDPEVHVTGLYWLDLDDQPQALRWAQQQQKPYSEVPIADVYAKLPALGAGYRKALYLQGVANVRNPRLVKALKAALLALPNVSLRENIEVTGFIQKEGRIAGIEAAGGDILADRVVLAAGAWSGQLLKLLGHELPVQPVKGQMILYQCADDFLPSMVLAKGRYAIPRRDGHILVGSTLEHAGFDKTPTDIALKSLGDSAVELLPALADAQPVGHWAGLRPGSPEGIPFIGEVPGHAGLWLNCGHYRNGLVLAPASCRLLCDLLLQQPPVIDPAPYSPMGRLLPGELR